MLKVWQAFYVFAILFVLLHTKLKRWQKFSQIYCGRMSICFSARILLWA